jgi:hypothetical protein
MTVGGLAAALLLGAASGLCAQQTLSAEAALSAKLDPSGLVRVVAGDVELAVIELNAHGPEWQHAPQAGATARVTDLPDQAGKQFVGTLPVPNTEGGALAFTEILGALPQGLRLEYEVGVTKAMRLNGLQVSVLLPVAEYGGKELVITRPEDDPQVVTLPQEQRENMAQVWGGDGAKMEAAKGTDQAVTIELQAAADVVVQDLRQWKQPSFEIRFPAIMEDPPREVAAEDRFHLVLTVTFAAPVRLVGP